VLKKDTWNANGHCQLPGPSGPRTDCAQLPSGLQTGLSDMGIWASPCKGMLCMNLAMGPVMQVSLA